MPDVKKIECACAYPMRIMMWLSLTVPKISSWADLGFNALQSAPLHDVQLKPSDRIGPIASETNISIGSKDRYESKNRSADCLPSNRLETAFLS